MSFQYEVVERASDGVLLPIASLDVTSNYTDTTLNYKQVVFQSVTYRKTFTWTGSNLTKETRWIRQ